jgi:hypothetical protein
MHCWPTSDAGRIADAPNEKWRGIDHALRAGGRGLRPGSSLARLLASKRGVPNVAARPRLTTRQILAWVDAWRQRTGAWPSRKSGAILGTDGETWAAIHSALAYGRRGLPGGSSLARFLARHRGRFNFKQQPSLTVQQILKWADAHRGRTGKWPSHRSGPIHESPKDSWKRVDWALAEGSRGVGPGWTLTQLLAKHRGVRNPKRLQKLTLRQIVRWMQAYHRQTGKWPTPESGCVADSGGETWKKLQSALQEGRRGVGPGVTLARLRPPRRCPIN